MSPKTIRIRENQDDQGDGNQDQDEEQFGDSTEQSASGFPRKWNFL